MATKRPTIRPYNPEELVLLLTLDRVAILTSDIVDCFRILSKGTEGAVTERERKIELSKKLGTARTPHLNSNVSFHNTIVFQLD